MKFVRNQRTLEVGVVLGILGESVLVQFPRSVRPDTIPVNEVVSASIKEYVGKLTGSIVYCSENRMGIVQGSEHTKKGVVLEVFFEDNSIKILSSDDLKMMIPSTTRRESTPQD